jgi:hypothetical protein
MEFISDHISTINPVNRTISLKQQPDILIPLLKENNNNHIPPITHHPPRNIISMQVSLVQSIRLPPLSSTYVLAKVSGPPSITTTDYPDHLFESSDVILNELNLSAPTALVTLNGDQIIIELVNETETYQHIPTETFIGTINAVKIQTPSIVSHIIDYPTQRTDQQLQEDFNHDLTSALNSNKCSLNQQQQQQLKTLIIKNKLLFGSNIPHKTTTLTSHRIDTGDHPPISLPPYRVSPSQKEEIERQVQQMLDNNIIQPSDSPYASPVLLVKKQDGTYRFCVDYRRLNAITRRDVYPLPRVDDTLDALGHATIFSTLDLCSGYWQIPVHKDDIHKTAFNVPNGHYEFKVLPFGLTNAPASFQRTMDVVLRKHKSYCLVFIDDIIIFSENFNNHLIHLQQVFNSIADAGLTIKLKKCRLGKDEVRFLGHLVSHQTIKPDAEKIVAVQSFPVPQTVSQLQSFIGLVGYYRRFIPKLSSIAEPLYKLLKKNVRWEWKQPQQQAFDQLKSILTSSPILSLPDFTKEFYLHTDASATGLGAVLTQVIDGVERVISYASKTLNETQRRYSITEREALAIVWATRLFRPYLLGRHFIIYTDHRPLKGQMKHKDITSRLMRMVLALQDYEFDIAYRPGSQHGNADSLSRLPTQLQNDNPMVHYLAAITRSKTGTLPPIHRTGMDPELVLDPAAYELERAIKESQGIYDESTPEEEENIEDASNISEIEEDESSSTIDLTEVKDETHITHDNTTITPSVDTSISDSNKIKSLQRQDPILKPIIDYLETSELPENITDVTQIPHYNPAYKLKNWILYYDSSAENDKVPSRYNTRTTHRVYDTTYRLVIPKTLHSTLLKEYHDGTCGAHLGINKTYEKIKNKYYWETMYSDIKNYISSCDKCERRKTKLMYHSLPIGSIPFPSHPFECLGIDILGPLPETDITHNKYILVVVDYFTRWPIAFPLTNARGKTIATVLVEKVFLEHGFPSSLLSDRGTAFMSELMLAILHIFRVKKLSTSSYHPQSNGMTERFNQTLATMLTHYTQHRQKDWDRYLPYVLYAYRTSPHSITKYSPFYLVYGREATYPFDIFVRDANTTNVESLCTEEEVRKYVNDLITRLNVAHDIVMKEAKEAQEAREENNRQIDNLPCYPVGSLVLLYTPAIKEKSVKKLSALWQGPFKVIEILDNKLNYIIHRVNKKGEEIKNAKNLLVHVSRLKEYKRPDMSIIRQLEDEAKNQ